MVLGAFHVHDFHKHPTAGDEAHTVVGVVGLGGAVDRAEGQGVWKHAPPGYTSKTRTSNSQTKGWWRHKYIFESRIRIRISWSGVQEVWIRTLL